MLPTDRANALVSSLASENRPNAEAVLTRLIAWSNQRLLLLQFDQSILEYPHVRFSMRDGRAFWIARGTTNNDAKIEILTRTLSDLPASVLDQLYDVLGPILPREHKRGNVLQIPTAVLRSSASLDVLEAAMDFALGAAATLVTYT